MKKIVKVLLVVLLVAAVGLGGAYAYVRYSRSEKSVAARTMSNLRNVESVSMTMKVDAGVKAQVGILQFFGVDDPETTISMNYDIDLYKEPALMHANVNISAFDLDMLKDIEVFMTEENGENVGYYRMSDKWYRYVAGTEEVQEPSTGEGTDSLPDLESESDISEPYAGNQIDSLPTAVLTSMSPILKTAAESNVRGSSEDSAGESVSGNSGSSVTDIIDFNAILEGMEDGSLTFAMREEPETVNGKECYVFDIDLTGDMFEKVIGSAGSGKGLIPKLNADEHVTGVLYIDSEESLPAALNLSTGEIFSEQMNLEQFGTSISVTKVDIDIDMTGYNIGTAQALPAEYVDITDLDGLDANQWLDLLGNLTGFGSETYE